MVDTIIVGAGLFGSILACHLRFLGQKVVVIDDIREGRGSKPAACLMKPGWFSSMGEKADVSLALLDKYYGVKDLRFRMTPLGIPLPVRATVHWVSPDKVLARGADIFGRVSKIIPRSIYSPILSLVDYVDLNTRQQVFLEARNVVVAAGVWTDELLHLGGHQITAQAGCSHLYRTELDEPFISPWAPYKQMVGFNIRPGYTWIGDGAAIKPENWPDHVERNRARCDAVAGGRIHVETMYGLRPYVKNAKPCLIHEVEPGLVALTGGAKNGTIAAGWAAHHIGELLS